MKKEMIFLLLSILLFTGCDYQNSSFEVSTIKTPFVFDRESKYFIKDGIQIDSSQFNDPAFSDLKTGRLFSIAQVDIKDSIITLLVNENPTENWTGTFYLINYSKEKKPISYLFIYDYGSSTIKTNITKDTIYQYINYQYSGWVKKYVVTPKGEFDLIGKKMIWEEDYDPN